MAYYMVHISTNNQYYAVLYSSNTEPICWTETYVSEQGARSAIAWIKANAFGATVNN